MPRVWVVYALPEEQALVEVEAPAGTTVAEAVARSRLPERFAAIASQPLVCAIYGRPVPLGQVLSGGERVEILRPLAIDPKQSRREAAARGRSALRNRKA